MRILDYHKLRLDISQSPETSGVYIGCDSRLDREMTLFGLVVIVHIESSKGGRCYAEKYREQRRMQMKERLMKEVELSVGCAFELCDIIGDRNFEIHLDINPRQEHKSFAVMGNATGYVTAQGFDYRIKPNAFAASTAADYLIS